MRASAALVLVALLAPLAGCVGFLGDDDARSGLVPYPRMGDVATYAVQGAHVELGRWENGHAFLGAAGQLRFTLAPGEKVLDAARAVHPTFKVTTERAEGGAFMLHSERFVSPLHQAIVQARYPLSQDQSTLSFDERGYPWLLGASPLFGADLSQETEVAFELPDNLGRGVAVPLAWRVDGIETVDGVEATRLVLEGAPGMEATLWMEPGSAWPLRASVKVATAGLAPHVRIDGPVPVSMEARRVEVKPGADPLPGRDRGATFTDHTGLAVAAFDGEKPPDGMTGYIPYLLADAARDAKLLDRGLAAWLATADDPRLYRGTYQELPAPLPNLRNQTWLLSYMDRAERYYTVQVYRLDSDLLGLGVPIVNGSGPSEAPRDPNHGWFPASALPPQMVSLSEGVRLVRDAFGAQRVDIFLRSFADPPGYSYYIDGGFEGPGRYTVIVNPATGLIENATGPVTVRTAEA